MKPKRWQDWCNVVIGVWLVMSPWLLGFDDQRNAALAAWILGAAVVAFAAIGAYIQKTWEEAINVVLGLVLIGAPWMFGFSDQQTPTANAAFSGVLVFVFAILAMLRNVDLEKLRDQHHPSSGHR
jgi:hypothetical protein